MSSQFSFPELPTKEIVLCLNELGIPFSADDLTNPHPSTVRMVYDNFVEMLTGVSRDAAPQPSFEALDKLSFPELYDESIPELAFLRSLFKITDLVGLSEFTTRDLTHPEFKRTKKIFSGIINFIKFKDERSIVYQELADTSEQIREEQMRLHNQVEELQSQLQSIENKRKSEEPTIQRLDAEAKELGDEIFHLNQKQAELQSAVQVLKAASIEIADKISNHRFQIMNVNQETAKLKSQIVPEPEKLRKLVEDMKVSLENEKEQVVDAEKRSHELQARYESICRVEKEIMKSIKLLEETEAEMGRNKTAKKDVKEMKNKLVEGESVLRELNSNEMHAQRQIKSTQEKISRLSKQEGEKKELAAQALQEALQQKTEMEKQRAATKGVVDQNSNAVQQLQSQIEMMKRQHEMEMNSIKDKYDQLEETIADYHRNLFKTVKTL